MTLGKRHELWGGLLQTKRDSSTSETTRSLGYLKSCGTGRSISGTGGCLASEETVHARGRKYSLEQPIDSLEGLLGAKGFVGPGAPGVVLDEVLRAGLAGLVLCFLVPRDLPLYGPWTSF